MVTLHSHPQVSQLYRDVHHVQDLRPPAVHNGISILYCFIFFYCLVGNVTGPYSTHCHVPRGQITLLWAFVSLIGSALHWNVCSAFRFLLLNVPWGLSLGLIPPPGPLPTHWIITITTVLMSLVHTVSHRTSSSVPSCSVGSHSPRSSACQCASIDRPWRSRLCHWSRWGQSQVWGARLWRAGRWAWGRSRG